VQAEEVAMAVREEEQVMCKICRDTHDSAL